MSNWFQDHPVTSIISHTVVVAAATWAFSYFVLDENKINFYKAQSENYQAQINNEKTVSEQYKAKVSVLEQEISKLRAENNRYLSWLLQNEQSFPSLSMKISKLEREIKKVKEVSIIPALENIQQNPIHTLEYKPYSSREDFKKGESFIDPETFASIGVSSINPDYTIDGVINIPGQENIEVKDAKPGKAWNFEKDGKDYRLSIDSINWINNSINASVREITVPAKGVTSGSK